MTMHKEERITLEMANKIQDAIDSEALAWMSDKGYSISTHEKQAVFAKNRCWCHTCRPISFSDPESMRMVLCPVCGNKRCPKATDHRLECTNSNEPNQKGSIY